MVPVGIVDPEERHEPLGICTHPAESLIPFANVDVAVPVTLSPPVCTPPANVEVAAVFVALMNPTPGEVEADITPLLNEIKY